MPTSSSREMSPGTSAGTVRSTIAAVASPSTPPPTPSITLSVRSWRTSRQRPCAERGVHRQRPLARHPLREQQPRHIDAGDQQHQPRRHRQGQKGRPILTDHLFEQRHHPGIDVKAAHRPLASAGRQPEHRASTALQQGPRLYPRLLRRNNPGRESPERVEGDHDHHTGLLPRSSERRRRERRNHERRPDLPGRVGEVEPLTEHTDDGVRGRR